MYFYVLSEIELQNLSPIEVLVDNEQPEEPSTQDDETESRKIGIDDSSLTSSQTMSSPKVATKGSPTPLPSTKPSMSSMAKTEFQTEGSDVNMPDLSKLDKTAETPSIVVEKPVTKSFQTDHEPESLQENSTC